MGALKAPQTLARSTESYLAVNGWASMPVSDLGLAPHCAGGFLGGGLRDSLLRRRPRRRLRSKLLLEGRLASERLLHPHLTATIGAIRKQVSEVQGPARVPPEHPTDQTRQ
jgi:hypothetical protein